MSEAFFRPEGRNYQVLQTRPRCERKVAEALDQLGQPHFLPLYRRKMERKAGGGKIRRYESRVPLFPGYVFAAAGPDELKLPVVASLMARVIVVLPVQQSRMLEQLGALKQALDSPYAVEPFEGLVPGVEVRITAGPLKGVEGRVVEQGNRREFVIQVDLIGRSVRVPVDASFLRQTR